LCFYATKILTQLITLPGGRESMGDDMAGPARFGRMGAVGSVLPGRAQRRRGGFPARRRRRIAVHNSLICVASLLLCIQTIGLYY
jgi:hypothetical protein